MLWVLENVLGKHLVTNDLFWNMERHAYFSDYSGIKILQRGW